MLGADHGADVDEAANNRCERPIAAPGNGECAGASSGIVGRTDTVGSEVSIVKSKTIAAPSPALTMARIALLSWDRKT